MIKVDFDHRGLRPEDVFLASYPRSGNAWLRFLLLAMYDRPLGFGTLKTDMPYMGQHADAPRLLPTGGRIIKTHEPYLPAYRRAIHLVRDPRDVVLSYFRFMQRIEKIVVASGDDVALTFDRFVDAFLAGRVDAHGTWQSHLDSWLAAAGSGACEVLRIRYEDLRAEPVQGVRFIANWLGLDVSPERAAEIVELCSIEHMRDAEREALRDTPRALPPAARRTGISVIGQGSVGSWRDALSSDQQRRFNSFAEGIAAMGYEAPIQP